MNFTREQVVEQLTDTMQLPGQYALRKDWLKQDDEITRLQGRLDTLHAMGENINHALWPDPDASHDTMEAPDEIDKWRAEIARLQREVKMLQGEWAIAVNTGNEHEQCAINRAAEIDRLQRDNARLKKDLEQSQRMRYHCGGCDEQFVSPEEARKHIKTCPELPYGKLREAVAAALDEWEATDLSCSAIDFHDVDLAMEALRIAAGIKAPPQDGDAGDRADEAYQRKYK